MRQLRKTTAAAIAGLGALAMFATPSFAAGDHGTQNAAASAQIAHLGQGKSAKAGQRCPMGMAGQGMMGAGMMGPGMMGRGMYGEGMMGRGMMGRGMMGPGFGHRIVPAQDLSVDDVRHYLEDRLAVHGNERLKVGDVKRADDGTIVADIVTVDGSLVERFNVNRHTGALRRAK